jgi:tetratricopeptide (TPR) repeat protein
MKSLFELIRVSELIRRCRGLNLNPVQRTAALYMAVIIVISVANFSFVRFRVPLYGAGGVIPDAGVLLLYFWIILWLDELLHFLRSNGALATIIGKVKLASLGGIAIYAVAALFLAVNSFGALSGTTKPGKVIAISSPYRGSWSYGAILVGGWDGADAKRVILLASRRERALYPGEEIEVVLRRGALLLNQVVEVRRDMEKYYGHMLEAAPDSTVALRGLVYVYARKGNFDEALKWYSRYAEKGDLDEVGTQLAQRMIDASHYRLAAALLKALIKEDRGYENLYTLGYALAWAGEKQEAAAYLQEATELDPADYRAFYSLGYVYRDTSQFAKAKQAWETVLTLMPHFPEVEGNLREVEQNL